MNRQSNNRPKHKALLLAAHSRHRRLSDEEQDLWNKIVSEIQPLKNRHSHQTPAASVNTELIENKRKTPSHGFFQAPSAAPKELPAISHGHSVGLDKNTAKRLRRGQMEIEANLDLHGLTQDAAFRALSSFIESSFRMGRRCVRIVTGKGARGEGVLRNAVPNWLNSLNLRPLVLSFSHALPKDGGDGALYVLIRRLR